MARAGRCARLIHCSLSGVNNSDHEAACCHGSARHTRGLRAPAERGRCRAGELRHRWPARLLRGHSHKPGVPDLMALPATLDTVEPDPHPSGVPTVAWPESLGEGGRPLVCVVSPPRCSRGQSPPSRPSGNVAALLARAPSGPRLLAPAGAAGSPGLGSAGRGGWSQALEDGQ